MKLTTLPITQCSLVKERMIEEKTERKRKKIKLYQHNFLLGRENRATEPGHRFGRPPPDVTEVSKRDRDR